jgi:superfamily I DNA and/or RNA helicase
MYEVLFSGSTHLFTYRKERLLVLSNPEKIDMEGRGIYIRNKLVSDIAEVYRFGNGEYTFWHIVCESGYYMNEDGRYVYLSRTRINLTNKNLWEYLNHVALETGLELRPPGADEPMNVLHRQYNLVDVNRDTVSLVQYLGGKERLKTFTLPKHIIYPFGCNASQKKAVENALTNQVSIIQGPPGTGKTQTVLNIIANLLIMGKTILVASNNNSAVDNVAEKLSTSKVGLEFIVAKLGSRENQTRFIENQPVYPRMSDWLRKNNTEIKHAVDKSLLIVSEGFDKQIQLSQLRTELSSLETERKYNENMVIADNALSWLNETSSAKLLKLLQQLHDIADKERKMGFILRLRWTLTLGLKAWSMLKRDNAVNMVELETAYYASLKKEIEMAIENISAFLKYNNIQRNVDILNEQSLILLKDSIARKYKGRERTIFGQNAITGNSEAFLKEYPVVLSTTYSAKSCISRNMVFDYVIMDEASQVDIATGALALSCAENAVIVGDDKQLPNVIDGKTRQAIINIENAHGIDDKYKITTHSFLQSCNEVFKDSPTTLLREHYRCQPKIIEFCNKMFYDGELVIMTKNDGSKDTLSVVRTVPGNHAREHVNQREIDVIAKEVMPNFASDKSVGIISPYKNQSIAINAQLHQNVASTVHKYQGRECDTIIMSMVDNKPTSFSDDANLLNVAISRAKSKLCIVATGNELPEESILSQLIEYIKYNNFEVQDSQLHSVFDILYKQYTQQRLEYEKLKGKDLDILSENVVCDTLKQAILLSKLKNIAILRHYPLFRLIADEHKLSDEQRKFAKNPLTHVDILLYNTLTKRPLLCIEVDGWQHHYSEVQKLRDRSKDEILEKFGLKIERLSTTSDVDQDTIKYLLMKIFGVDTPILRYPAPKVFPPSQIS